VEQLRHAPPVGARGRTSRAGTLALIFFAITKPVTTEDAMEIDVDSFDDSGEVEFVDSDGDDDGGDAEIEAGGDHRTGEFAGKITKVTGDVIVHRPDGSKHPATSRTILIKGDVLVTGKGSKAEYRPPTGGTVRVGSRTAIHAGSGRHKGTPSANASDEG
jgi:hypothetical protein